MPGKLATQPELVEVLLIKLKHRLRIEPDDVDGWVLLSKSYYHLNRLNEANEAFEKAKTLGYTGDWQPLPKQALKGSWITRHRISRPWINNIGLE